MDVAVSQQNCSGSIYVELKAKNKKPGLSCCELSFVLRHDTSHQDAIALHSKISEIIACGGGEIKKIEYWGLRNLAYKIKKNKRAHFYCFQFSSNGQLNTELCRNLKISSIVIRYIILRIRDFDLKPTSMITDLESAVADGSVTHDERYVIKLDD